MHIALCLGWSNQFFYSYLKLESHIVRMRWFQIFCQTFFPLTWDWHALAHFNFWWSAFCRLLFFSFFFFFFEIFQGSFTKSFLLQIDMLNFLSPILHTKIELFMHIRKDVIVQILNTSKDFSLNSNLVLKKPFI